MTRRVLTVLVAMAAIAPGIADAGVLSIEGFYGFARPPSADFSSAVSGVADDEDLADDSLQLAGGAVLFNLGGLQIGAIGDTSFDGVPAQTAIGGLVGLRLGDRLRLDALAELGGHRFGEIDDLGDVTGSSSDEWFFYVGLRPGIAYRLGTGSSGIFIGLWGFVRWDVNSEDTPVNVSGGAPSPGTVDLGGTTIGATLRLGIEL